MRAGNHCAGLYLPVPAPWVEGGLRGAQLSLGSRFGSSSPARLLLVPAPSSWLGTLRANLQPSKGHGGRAKGTVAARLVCPLVVTCRGLAGEEPGAEVTRAVGAAAFQSVNSVFLA